MAAAAPAAAPQIAIVYLQPNEEVASRWKVLRKLGEGGFGAVYLVKDNIDGKEYALKSERTAETTRVLKMEVYVLTALKKANAKHFCDLVDSGHFTDYNYVVMSLVGLTLHDLRKKPIDSTKQKFSLGTALSVGIKCVEAIEELHNIGFLHRDLKPGNFATDRQDIRKIVLFDFGMCRKYVDARGNVRKPRWAAGFRGTLRYAPISCHISRELCRKDDLETWLYQQIEITRGHLPWRHLEDKDEVGRFKEKCRAEDNHKDLFAGCPREYIDIMNYLDTLRYYDNPDYQKIYDLMKQVITAHTLQEYPYDWEKPEWQKLATIP
uniref:Protein kinase domain-containing protein n=1 Tax=Steinernema glaseri TaxID=37863 RepID=A0A1I7ZIZ8_9BILA